MNISRLVLLSLAQCRMCSVTSLPSFPLFFFPSFLVGPGQTLLSFGAYLLLPSAACVYGIFFRRRLRMDDPMTRLISGR